MGIVNSPGLWCECSLHFDYGVHMEGSGKRLGHGTAQQLEAVMSKSCFLGVRDVAMSSHRTCDHREDFYH